MPASDEIADLMNFARFKASDFTRNPDYAEEAVADVFEKLTTLDYWPENPKAWITVAVDNRIKSIAKLKHNKDKVANQVPANDPDDSEVITDLNVMLMRAQNTSAAVFNREIIRTIQATLSERELQLIFAVMQGLNHQEIADLLDYASAASVAQTLSRIRIKLSQELKGWDLDFINRRVN